MNRPIAISAGPESPGVESKRSMELLFASLEERGVPNPRKLTEFELYSRLEHFRKPTE